MLIEQVRKRVTEGPIPKAEYQELNDALEEIRAPRDPAWVEAWIVLHCATRQRAFACQRLLSRYNRQCVKRGTMDEYSEFLRHVQDDLGYFLPNGNAYTENFRSVDVGEIMAQCEELSARFAELKLEVFANSGTLLGIVREGTLLEHDNDIDLGVLLTARTFEEAAQEWITLTDKLIADGVGVSRSKWSKVTLKLQKIGAFGVDLFPAWIDENDKVYVYPHTFGTLTRDQLLPYDLHSPTGLHLPADAEAMLECNYGESWRVPNVGWGFDWKTANAHFEVFLAAVEAATVES